MLEIKNFVKRYGEKVAVNNINLTVNDDEICAFIGHNGAGKTTTLKAIAGILDFEEGEILVNGLSVKNCDMEVKKQIAFVPDNPDIYEHLTGIEYLNFISDVFGLSANERKENIEYYSKRLNINNNLGEVIGTYSHGMKQKVVLVSALIHKPKLILLDEPFVGLDPATSHEFKEIMQELSKQGVTIFYSTHVLDVAEKICSHVAIIKDGKIVASGEMKKVKGKGSLEKLFLGLENND